MSICVHYQIPCFSVYDNLWEDYDDREERISPHQNPKIPIGEAFSKFLSILVKALLVILNDVSKPVCNFNIKLLKQCYIVVFSQKQAWNNKDARQTSIPSGDKELVVRSDALHWFFGKPERKEKRSPKPKNFAKAKGNANEVHRFWFKFFSNAASNFTVTKQLFPKWTLS